MSSSNQSSSLANVEVPGKCNINDRTLKIDIKEDSFMDSHAPENKELLSVDEIKPDRTDEQQSHSVKRFVCSICSKSFSYECYLKNHLLIHDDKKKYSCNICKKTFKTMNSAEQHRRFIHEGEKLHVCNTCNRTFGNKSNLNTHMLIHKRGKKFSCDICFHAFKDEGSLKNHQRHFSINQQPFRCEYCDKMYCLKNNLYSHKRRKHKHQALPSNS